MLGIVMLARSDTRALKEMAECALETAKRCSPEDTVIQVLDSGTMPASVSGVWRGVVPQGPFNYHASMNRGIAYMRALNEAFHWWALVNSDLVFHPGWFDAILAAHVSHPHIGSFSPSYPGEPWEGPEVREGYGVGGQVRGWCLVLPDSTLRRIELTEDVSFWCSDNAYEAELIKHGIPHAVVKDSDVTHLGGKTLFSRPGEEIHDLTAGQVARWSQKQRGEK